MIATSEIVAFDDCADWLEAALGALHSRAADVAGPDGALYSDEFFSEGAGEVTAFVPVSANDPDSVELPPTTVAVLLHEGPVADLDQAYGLLETIVAERGIGGPGPIREHYLAAERTEVCWPVTTGRTS